MARNNYSAGKRQRERDKARKKRDKAQRRRDNQTSGGGIPIATADEIQGGDMLSIDEVVNNIYAEPDADAGRAHAIPCRLFIGGLNWRVTTDELQKMMEEYGPVSDAFIVTDRDTGDSRGFGFVTMRDRRDASQAIRKLNGEDFHGRTLVVRLATERQR